MGCFPLKGFTNSSLTFPKSLFLFLEHSAQLISIHSVGSARLINGRLSPKSDQPVFDPRVQPSAQSRCRCWYIYFSSSLRLTLRLAARSEMTVNQPHVAELKRRAVLGEGRSLESEWSGAIKGLSTTLRRKADGSLLDLDWVLCTYFLLGSVRHLQMFLLSGWIQTAQDSVRLEACWLLLVKQTASYNNYYHTAYVYGHQTISPVSASGLWLSSLRHYFLLWLSAHAGFYRCYLLDQKAVSDRSPLTDPIRTWQTEGGSRHPPISLFPNGPEDPSIWCIQFQSIKSPSPAPYCELINMLTVTRLHSSPLWLGDKKTRESAADHPELVY